MLQTRIVPSFNKYFTQPIKKYKKSIAPIINKINDTSKAKIITIHGTIIENESNINQVI